MQLAVIAKEPRPGRVKTRLCPPATPVQAAAIAATSLAATLATVAATPATRRVLVLDGRPGPWIPAGFDVVAQRGDGLDERLTHAFTDCFAHGPDEPVAIIGMDTPQVRVAHLLRGLRRLVDPRPGHRPRAVLGPARDGGYWFIGLSSPHDGAIRDVAMSTADTFRQQHDQLVALGYDISVIDELTDVDTMGDAAAVAASLPGSAFTRAVRAVRRASGERPQLATHVAHGADGPADGPGHLGPAGA